MPNDGVAFTTESEEVDVHATDVMKLTRSGKPVICHICGNNRYANMCPYREERSPKKKAEKVKDTPNKESAPTKASVNGTIGEDWRYNNDYRGQIFCQVMAETATNEDPKM